MRDFLPAQARRRNQVFDVIREVYQGYGFEPLQTPAMERLSTLLGKYGEEGDQLIFKVMKRGNKFDSTLARNQAGESLGEVDFADMGLRYDLTVPLARVMAEYQNELPSIFKRYQIAPVWRADRPQHGRFREFYQCDVDVIGSTSMTVEAEVVSALSEVLNRLGFSGYRIHLNHRRLLDAMMETAGVPAALRQDALVAIDKIDKIGRDGVLAELQARGISQSAINGLMPLLEQTTNPTASDNETTLSALSDQVGHLPIGQAALSELRQILTFAAAGPAGAHLVVDPYLARGLSYYTGPIFEIRSDEFSGSLGGGGRYDDLIGMFGKKSLPACGFSLGIERILVLLQERGPVDEVRAPVDVLVTLWNEELTPHSFRLLHELRQGGIRAEIYPDNDRMGKQFAYADERHIPLVAILAPDELAQGVVGLKELKSGTQEKVARADAAGWIRQRLGA